MGTAVTAEHHDLAAFTRWIDLRPSLVIMQPDTFCNLDCAAYCYLPLRKSRNRMPDYDGFSQHHFGGLARHQATVE